MRTRLVRCAAGLLFLGGLALAVPDARGQGTQPDRPTPPPGPHEEKKLLPGGSGTTQPGEQGTQEGMSDRSGKMDTQGNSGKMRKHKSAHPARKSKDVREAQMKLKDSGFDPGPIDGMLGRRTGKALRDYQQSHNLKATGRLDSKTKQMLMASKENMPQSTMPGESAPKSMPGESAPSGSTPGRGSSSSGSSGPYPSGSPGSSSEPIPGKS